MGTTRKTKVLEHCPGSHSAAHEHAVFGAGKYRKRVCRFCDKLISEYPNGDCASQLRVHGRYLSTSPQA